MFSKVLKRAFDMFDREKKGSIACNNVGSILRTLGQTFEESDLQVSNLIDLIICMN